jgi:HK97 family phage major capsid protein
MATKRERLEKLVHDMKAYADELDAKEAPTADEVKKLNDMGTDVVALKDAIVAEATAGGTVDMAKAFLADLAGTPTPGSGGGGGGEAAVKDGIVNPAGMTLGEAFVKSPAYAEFVDNYRGADGRIREVSGIKTAAFELGGFDRRGFNRAAAAEGRAQAKALVTGADDTSGGAFVTPYRYAPVTDLIGERELTVRDLCTNIPITTDTFEFVQVTGKTNNAAAVAEATSADDPTVVDGVITPVAGAGLKPESALTLAVKTTPVETIAHLMPITRRAAADAPQVRALVDAFLLYGLAEEEEDQLLNGNGTSPNLRGILQTAGILTVGSAGTDLDAVVDAIRTVRARRRRPTAMVVHPNDWYSTGFLLAKDGQGRYILGDPRADIDQLSTLWGLRVVVTEAMTENTALVGEFRQAVVADRQQSAIYVTDSHKDWFARNLLAVLAEERLGFGVLDPEAFCTVTAI